ncbi:Outer membrane porin F [Patescibacteria group bacterium]|nr:Outer membrane porin F [Patescibacteria group bacterium]
MKTKILLLALSGILGLTQIAYAETNFGKQTPTTDDVIKALNPNSNPDTDTTPDSDYEGDIETGASKTRMIDMSNLGGKPKAAKTKTGKKKVMPEKKIEQQEAALSMEIIFGYNSAELTEAAKAQLKPVGEALASGKLHDLSFIVEGHTDAVGGDSYNKSLSEQRAASVKAFLVTNYNLNPSIIQIIGMGKRNLLDPSNPTSEINRRVRIVARK